MFFDRHKRYSLVHLGVDATVINHNGALQMKSMSNWIGILPSYRIIVFTTGLNMGHPQSLVYLSSVSTNIRSILQQINVKINHLVFGPGIQAKRRSYKDPKKRCGQSYKGSTIVNYDSRVVIRGIFKSGTTLES